MDNKDMNVEQSLDEMLNSLNSINDSFINDYFEHPEKEENTDQEKEQIFEEEKDNEVDIKEQTENKKEEQMEQTLEDELLLNERKERIFDINREIPKVEPKVDDILNLIENSVNGEEFFDRIEDEFLD